MLKIRSYSSTTAQKAKEIIKEIKKLELSKEKMNSALTDSSSSASSSSSIKNYREMNKGSIRSSGDNSKDFSLMKIVPGKKISAKRTYEREVEVVRQRINEYMASFGKREKRDFVSTNGENGRGGGLKKGAIEGEGEVAASSSKNTSSYFFNPYWQKTEQVLDYATIDAVARAYKKPPNPISSLRHAGVQFPHVLFHPATLRWYKEYWLSLYQKVFLEKPFLAAMATSVFKCVSSDAFVQIFVEGNSHLDYQRVACFFALGVAYVGAFQYSLYNHILKPVYGMMKPRIGIPGATGAVVAADQLFVAPFVYFPTFLAIKMWSENKTTAGEFYGTLKALWNDTVFETMRALWVVWIPAQMINFWIVPRHLTIPFMNVVGFGWNGILSYVHGQRKILNEKEREDAIVFVEKMQPLFNGD